ncbi:hypothetical protein FQN57_005189 [Myotisia sp. PD_48]|nr:hypothetical protein FQN57_005189 [Myotisia sp. PD_48]
MNICDYIEGFEEILHPPLWTEIKDKTAPVAIHSSPNFGHFILTEEVGEWPKSQTYPLLSILNTTPLLEQSLIPEANFAPVLRPPPTYDDALSDPPPEYSGDDYAHGRCDVGENAPMSVGPRQKEKSSSTTTLFEDPFATIHINLDDSSRFRSHAKKKKGAAAKKQDAWADTPEDSGAAKPGDDGGAAGGADGGGEGGAGAGGAGGGGGGNDDDWAPTSNKKKKKTKKEEEEKKRKEEEEKRRKEEEEEAETKRKKEEEEAEEKRRKEEEEAEAATKADAWNVGTAAGNEFSWADEVDNANGEDNWDGFASTTKKKKGKKAKAETTASTQQSDSFQDISLGDNPPQLNLSFTGEGTKTGGNTFEFGGWGNNWNTGDDKTNDWKGDALTTETENEISLATASKKKKKKGAVEMLPSVPEPQPPPPPEPEPEPESDKKSKKKKPTSAWAFEAEDDQDPAANNFWDTIGSSNKDTKDTESQDKPPEDGGWGEITTKKDKKKKKNAVVEARPLSPPPPEPEKPEEKQADPMDFIGFSSKKDKKKKKGSVAPQALPAPIVEEPPPEVILDIVEDLDKDPVDDEWASSAWEMPKSKKSVASKPEPILEDLPKEEASYSAVPSKKDKKKRKTVAETLVQDTDPIDSTPDNNALIADTDFTEADKKKAGKHLAKDETLDPVPEPAEEPTNQISPEAAANMSKKELRAFKKKGGVVIDPALIEPPTEEISLPEVDFAPLEQQESNKPDDTGLDNWGVPAKATKKSKKGAVVTSVAPVAAPEIATSTTNDVFGFSTNDKKNKKKKKGSNLEEPSPPPPAPPPPPPAPEEPTVIEEDSWLLESSKRGKKAAKGSKSTGIDILNTLDDTPKIDDGLDAFDTAPKEDIPPENESGANGGSTDLVASTGSWNLFGLAGNKKKTKKTKGINELPPPAPTPPEDPIQDDADDTTWNNLGGSWPNSMKKTSLSRTTTSTSKASKTEEIKQESKLSKTKSKGFEVVDVTDVPLEVPVEPEPEPEPASKGYSWASFAFTAKPAKPGTKWKDPKSTPVVEPEVKNADVDVVDVVDVNDDLLDFVTEEKPKKAVTGKKKRTKDAPEPAEPVPAPEHADKQQQPLDIDQGPTTKLKPSSSAADKASRRPSATSVSASKALPGKSSVAERIKLLEQNKKLERRLADEKTTSTLTTTATTKSKDKKSKVTETVPELLPLEDLVEEPPVEPPTTKKEPVSAPAKVKSKSKKTKPVPDPDPVLILDDIQIAEAPTPRDSVPGSFPGADDDLVDVVIPDPQPVPTPAAVKVQATNVKTKKASAAKRVSPNSSNPSPLSQPAMPKTPPEPSPSSPAVATTPALAGAAKPAKRERVRVERTAGTSWALWGASSQKKPVRREAKLKSAEEPATPATAIATPTKDKEKSSTGLSRSKSAATRKEKPRKIEKDLEKSSSSDRDKLASRPSRHSRGMSFPAFILGGQPPTRMKSTSKRPSVSTSKPVSRRHSVDIDDSGVALTPDEEPRISTKAAKVMGVSGSKRSKRSSRAPPDPYAIDDDDFVKVSHDDGIAPEESRPKERNHKSKSQRRQSKVPNVDAEADSSGQGLDIGPDDPLFVDNPPRPSVPLRRSHTTPQKKSEGLFGFFSAFKPATNKADLRERSKSRHRRDEPARRDVDTDKERSKRRKKPSRVDTDVDGFGLDPPTEDQEAEARRRERRARKAAERERAEPESNDAEDRSARKAEKAKRRESRHTKSKSDGDQHPSPEENVVEGIPDKEEAIRSPNPEPRRSKHRPRESDDEARQARKTERRASRAAAVIPDRDTEDRRRSHKSSDERKKSKHRKSEPDRRSSRQAKSSHHPTSTSYPQAMHSGKDKTSSWVNSQLVEEPEDVNLAGTVLDVPDPNADINHYSLSDEEARRAAHRRQRRSSKYDQPDRVKRRESHRASHGPNRSNGSSGDVDNRGPKKTSWFKKFAGL